MKRKAYTLIFLEDGYKETELIQETVTSIHNIIIIGHAHSELKLIRMLKEFLPDILLLKAEMLSYEFLLKLYPLLNNSDVTLIIYYPQYKDEGKVKDLLKKLRFNLTYTFIKIDPEEPKHTLIDRLSLCMKNLLRTSPEVSKPKKRHIKTGKEKAEKLIIIGSSAGGPRILKNILLQFPSQVPAAIIIVQHIPFLFSGTLVESLSSRTSLKIKEAHEGDVLYNNHIYVAKGDYHLVIVDNNGEKSLHLHQRPKVWSVRPAIDVTMLSATKHYEDKIVAVILTGIGKDGTEGIKAIKKAGGTVIAQNQETSLIFGMPKSAIESGCVDFVLPYYKIADVSVNLISQK